MYATLAVLASFAFLYSLFAGIIERSWISAAIMFTAFGLLTGPSALDILPLAEDPETIKRLAELTLALVLFTDAAGANLHVLRSIKRLPLRLLLVGLPLTIGLGYVVGRLLFGDVPALEIALLATLLAPTDAALGKPVIANIAIPAPYREALNVESGLNDGICVPVLLLFLLLATRQYSGEESLAGLAFHLFVEEIGIGLLVGVILSVVAAKLGRYVKHKEWLDPVWSHITVAALAFACFGLAQSLGGSGFIAAFVGGITLNLAFEGDENKKYWLERTESWGNLFSLVTWSTFGALVVGPALAGIDWSSVVYALLSLTVIRMLPVFLVLTGFGMSTEAKLFMGWFGPRGLASVVFAVIVLDAALPNSSQVLEVAGITIILSILLHGLTALPWADGFARREQARANSQAKRES